MAFTPPPPESLILEPPGFTPPSPDSLLAPLARPQPVATPTPTTYYSLGAAAGGPEESKDSWTNRGYTATGRNLPPGIAAVNTSQYPLGTIFKDTATGYVYLAADRHGNRDPRVVDLYVPPGDYQARREARSFEVVGQVPQDKIPKTPGGVQQLLSNYGVVPEGAPPASGPPVEEMEMPVRGAIPVGVPPNLPQPAPEPAQPAFVPPPVENLVEPPPAPLNDIVPPATSVGEAQALPASPQFNGQL